MKNMIIALGLTILSVSTAAADESSTKVPVIVRWGGQAALDLVEVESTKPIPYADICDTLHTGSIEPIVKCFSVRIGPGNKRASQAVTRERKDEESSRTIEVRGDASGKRILVGGAK